MLHNRRPLTRLPDNLKFIRSTCGWMDRGDIAKGLSQRCLVKLTLFGQGKRLGERTPKRRREGMRGETRKTKELRTKEQ